MDQDLVDSVLQDWKTASIGERLRSALRLLEVMTLRPDNLNRQMVVDLQESGLTSPDLEEVAAVAFHFNFINRVSDAVDFTMLDTKQTARQARLLNLIARVVTGGRTPEPSWTVGNDGLVRPAELSAAREYLLGYRGSVEPKLRTSIEGTAASLWNASRAHYEIPKAVEDFVKPLSLYAYRIHDGLAAKVIEAGYSQRQLFEITLIGAFGAAIAAQEHLFEAMYEGNDRAPAA
ncbi:MAG: hypothetical protein AAF514_11830 [Verrucomicrobiota bacterium]